MSEKFFSEDEVFNLIINYEVEKIIISEGRWSRNVNSIVQDEDDKFYSLYWEEGLTERQDNYYPKQEVVEVEKKTYEKTIMITEWVKI